MDPYQERLRRMHSLILDAALLAEDFEMPEDIKDSLERALDTIEGHIKRSRP